MQRYGVTCYDAKDEPLANLTVEAPDKAVAEMMVLAQLHGTGTPLVDSIDKFVLCPEEQTAATDLAFGDEANPTASEDGLHHNRLSWDDDIKICDPEKLAHLASCSGAQIKRAAIAVGTLATTVIILLIGWNSLPAVPAAPVDQKSSSSVASPQPDLRMSTQNAKIDTTQQATQTERIQGKINVPASRSSDGRDSTQSTVQPISQTKTTAVLQQRDPSATLAVKDRPKTPYPETRPATINGWVIRQVANGEVMLQGPNGVWKVARGDTVPGLGRVDSIVRWGNRWIVSTTRGLITTQ